MPNVYLDCRWCDLDFIREKITFINIVRDRLDADIQVFANKLRTGSGGNEFSLIFIGRNEFDGIEDTLKYYTNQTDTDDSKREKMLRALKLGLVRYLLNSPLADNFNITYNGEKSKDLQKASDEWDYWVFRSTLRSFLQGEQTTNFTSVWGSFVVSRVTEDLKIRFFLASDYNESNFDYNNSTITNITRSHYFFSSFIKSLSDHWSAGLWAGVNSSTYKNIDLSLGFAPGIEYNIFPYSEVNVRQLKFNYRIWFNHNDYSDMTIYFKEKEFLFQQRFSASLDLIKNWGNIGMEVTYKNYLHDFSKNSIAVQGEVDLQLIKGLTLDLSGSFEAVHDQISLPYLDVSLEEVLLRRRELETQYTYRASIGFSYTFGSIYNNIVNTRFN